jgi:sporulation protein YunB
MKILVLNCGSSSAKYMVYDWDAKDIMCKGIVERVTIGGSFCEHEATGRDKVKIERECPTHKEAVELIMELLVSPEYGVLNDVKEIDAVNYQDLIFVQKDSQGRIVLMQPNIVRINQLVSDTTLYINNNLKELEKKEFSIPLGQVLGSQLLANYGPHINVKILPIGTVKTIVSDNFVEAGINQTRHRLYLNIERCSQSNYLSIPLPENRWPDVPGPHDLWVQKPQACTAFQHCWDTTGQYLQAPRDQPECH